MYASVQNTPIRSHISGRAAMLRASAVDSNREKLSLKGKSSDQVFSAFREACRQVGMDMHEGTLKDMVQAQNDFRRKVGQSYGMDSVQPTVTTASIITPLQFLQEMLPGVVQIQTAARKGDEIAGITQAGQWRDEQVVQKIMERTGTVLPYGDTTNVPFANFNLNFNSRTIVRFEEGFEVSILEEERAAAVQVDVSAEKRASAMLQLEINRNLIFFNGYNNGANNTYGFLNDPGKPAYVTVAVGAAGSTLWSRKTTQEIISDLLTFYSGIRTSSQDLIDPMANETTLVLPTSVVDYLGVITVQGISVVNWIKATYPKTRIVSAPELQSANSGSNVAILFADTVSDGSTDGGQVIQQVVPAKFRALGVVPVAKGFQEDYSNATAGCIYKRPWAVYCASGI